jgi:uncharacterized protein (TIGR03790 family)
MTHQRFTSLTAAATIVTCLWCAPPAAAQDPRNVLLILNEANADSVRIGAHYAKRRSIPGENVLRLRAPVSDEIDRRDFERTIEGPIAGWISSHGAQDQILYVVLTKGIPLRIAGSGNAAATTTASVDSELALLYRKLTGTPVPPTGPLPNPYYLGDRELTDAKLFSHAAADIYLVSRLDGFTVEDVIGLIDRGAEPGKKGTFVLDQRATMLGDKSGDAWLATAAKRLTAAGLGDAVVLDSSSDVLKGHKQVLGYYSWGSNDPAIKDRRFGHEFVPGALAAMFVSTDARTLNRPPSSWSLGTWPDTSTHFAGSPQSLTGDLIAEGATGVAGHVAEPFLGAAIRPQILFPAYVRGFNLIEAFYLAMPYVSWQTVVIGDPLCAPFRAQQLSSAESAPAVDPETDLPNYFSSRRVASIAAAGANKEAAKLIAKGEGLLARGNRDAARLAFESAIGLDGRLTFAHLTLASLYEQAGDHEKAAERYKAVLSYAPDEIVSLNNLAYGTAVYKKSPAEALPLAERAYKLAPASPLVADTLGWILHLVGRSADAEKLLLQAAKSGAGIAAIRLHLAQLYAETGRLAEARAELSAALTIDPTLENGTEVRSLREALSKPASAAPKVKP